MSSTNQQTDGNATPSAPPRYVPPHRNGTLTDTRYSKSQLLDLYRSQQTSDGGLRDGLPSLYVGGWQPDTANGAHSAGWSRNEHNRESQPGPDLCWERDGGVEPLGLTEMDDQERELFAGTVNTPLKPPSQQPKENQQNGLPGRKISVSGGSSGFGLPSPTTTRRPGQRRETSESYPFPNPLASPTYNREEQRAASPPPSLLRRRTDLKDAQKEDRDKDAEEKPFGSLRRNPTVGGGPLSAGFGAPSSPWAQNVAPPQSAGFTPMGSFGNFGLGGNAGQQGTPTSADKRPGLGAGRAESRFKNLLQKDSNEDLGARSGLERKTSISSLSKVNENESWRPQGLQDLGQAPLEEEDVEIPAGSSALGGQGMHDFSTPSRSTTRDEMGFGAFGMHSDQAHGFGQGYQQTPSQPQFGGSPQDPMSPTDTNPYKSPQQHGVDQGLGDFESDGSDIQNAHLPGLGGFGSQQGPQSAGLNNLGGLPSIGRGGPAGPNDRSQTSSTGPQRTFTGLGGLGQLGGLPGSAAWPVTQGGLGTPSRQTAGLNSAFGGGIFANNIDQMQSPSLAGLGGGSMLSPQGQTAFGAGRLGSMFPQGMQEQMRPGDLSQQERDERILQQQFGGINQEPARHSPFAQQAFAEQERTQPDPERDERLLQQAAAQQSAPGQQPQLPLAAHGQNVQARQEEQPPQPPSSASNQPPAPQQRTMVMPDRMRWIYRDPQGVTQGPWSGLEMHDWYKAGFFSPELLVKKYEDTEYEPLAQLIRRIGNSREPFLVPQIGIPHGAPSTQGPWAGGLAAPTAGPGGVAGASAGGVSSSSGAGGAQPPFASSFPSFGTTLTADQQNALERRKQEEQYLMARQKEHLAQAQIASRMQHAPGPHGHGPSGGHGLQHHSSAQSLHSQPSYGNMTSPQGQAFQPSPSQAPAPQGFFDNSFRGPQSGGGLGAVGAGVDSLGHIREEEIPSIMDRLNLGNRQAPGGQFGAPGQPFGQQMQQQQQGQDEHERQVQQMLQDRARLQQEQAEQDAREQRKAPEPQGRNERLEQFQQYQAQNAAQGGLDARFQPAVGKPIAPPQAEMEELPSTTQSSIGSPIAAQQEQPQAQEPLSLTEQVQKAASAQQSPAPAKQAWAKLDTGLPQPFPPAPSQSPLPAPAAQRTSRQSVADHLHAESRSRSQTPSVETPNAAVAPWAKEPAEAPKGPSLKEIQAIEAKKAAEAEKIAAAARRAAMQKEMEAQALAAATAPAPGLPASASWAAGEGASPATPTGSTASAWAKTAQKAAGPTTSKTLAQIQKEEEARKKRQAAALAQAQANAMSGVKSPAGGKSYANLAGVGGPPTQAPTAGGSAWTTVGASGKTKTPAPPASLAAAPAQSRAMSSGLVPTAGGTVKKAPSRSSTMTNSSAANAQEEFRKWAIAELRPDLNKGISGKFPHPLAHCKAQRTDKIA